MPQILHCLNVTVFVVILRLCVEESTDDYESKCLIADHLYLHSYCFVN
jgi:hypothetical protein